MKVSAGLVLDRQLTGTEGLRLKVLDPTNAIGTNETILERMGFHWLHLLSD